MTENKTGVRRPVSPKKQMAERQARESLAAVAQGWGAGAPQQSQAECEGVCTVTEEPGESPVLVRIPEEEKPAKGETLSAAARRRIWERSRYESMRLLPDAMAFHEEALARAMQQGEFEKLAKVNGLSEEEVRRVWDVHQDHHRIRVAAQAAGRTAEVPEVEDADDDELQTGEVSAREPTNGPAADVPRKEVEEPRSNITEAPDLHAMSVTQPKPEPKPMEQSQAQPMTSETEAVSCRQSERPPVGRLSEVGRRINEEVGREEHLRALAAAQRLAREGDEAIWEERLRFIKDRLRRTGVWTAAAGVCLLAGILATDLMGLRSRAIESVTSLTVFAPQPAVVDRQAAKKALLDLAGRAALEDVIVASEAFDDLFVLACARVAARENLLLLDSRAVVAMARGGEDATERIKEEIVDLVQKGAVARFKEIRRDEENR